MLSFQSLNGILSAISRETTDKKLTWHVFFKKRITTQKNCCMQYMRKEFLYKWNIFSSELLFCLVSYNTAIYTVMQKKFSAEPDIAVFVDIWTVASYRSPSLPDFG